MGSSSSFALLIQFSPDLRFVEPIIDPFRMTQFAPIALFAFNRPEHLRRTIGALSANCLAVQSELFVFSDAARSEVDRAAVDEVRSFLRLIGGFASVTIVERERNFGLAASIIDGVTDLTRRFGRVIVLEDDLITAPSFLTFMNEALDLYADSTEVWNIHGHVLDNKGRLRSDFFLSYADSYGWATWWRAWQHFESDGKKLLRQLYDQDRTAEFDFGGRYPFTRMLRRQTEGITNSWAIRWNATIFLHRKLAYTTHRSLVANIGIDGSGSNHIRGVVYRSTRYMGDVHAVRLSPIEENFAARRAIGRVHALENSFLNKVRKRLIRIFF